MPTQAMCVSGGQILDALGLHKAPDFDVLVVQRLKDRVHHLEILSQDTGGVSFSLQNEFFTGNDVDDIVMNPGRHIVLCGIKIMSLTEFRSFKTRRMSGQAQTRMKDFIHVLAIDQILDVEASAQEPLVTRKKSTDAEHTM